MEQRVFAKVSKRGEGEGAAGNGGRLRWEARMRNGTASASGRRWGGFKTRLQRQDVRGAWPARQKAGDGWRTCGVKTLRRSLTVF